MLLCKKESMKFKFLFQTIVGVVKGRSGKSKSCFRENKIDILRFTKKIAFFDSNLSNLGHFKSYAQSTAFLDVFIIHPLLVLSAAKRNPSKNTKRDDCPVTDITQY